MGHHWLEVLRDADRYPDTRGRLDETEQQAVEDYLRTCVPPYAAALDGRRTDDVPAPSDHAAAGQDGPLHGSIAFSQHGDGSYAWGIAWSVDSSVGAQSEAIIQCREYGGTQCAEAGWFREACGALAIGGGNGYGTGWGATTAEAERDALRQCRAANDDCRIEVARCSRSEEAGGRGRTENMDTAVDHAPADAPPSDNSEQACDAWEASYTQTWTEEGLQRGGINLTEAKGGFATKAEAEDFVQRICDSRHMAYGPGAGVDYVLESCTVGEARCVQPRSHAQQPGPPGEAPDPDDARPSDNSEQGCDNWAEPPWDEC